MRGRGGEKERQRETIGSVVIMIHPYILDLPLKLLQNDIFFDLPLKSSPGQREMSGIMGTFKAGGNMHGAHTLFSVLLHV